jgi:putative (di)nucleoside polyphosphate hydrolase
MEYAKSDARFFRAGVGTVIYNDAGEVAMFRRAKFPIGVWQFQQGGIDIGEDTETTLWRELKEEIGLDKSAIERVHEMPSWTIHPSQSSLDDSTKTRIGQAHKWYFLKLKSGIQIDLSKATDEEADAFRFNTFKEAIAECEPLKKPVYQELENYFKSKVIQIRETALSHTL